MPHSETQGASVTGSDTRGFHPESITLGVGKECHHGALHSHLEHRNI